MYSLVTATATLPAGEYIRDYREADKFIKYCMECNRYGTCWACPPFNFSVDDYLKGYKTAIIIGTKIILNEQLQQSTDAEKNKTILEEIIATVRIDLDKNLLDAETKLSGRAFFAGTCHLCPKNECTRKRRLDCKYPDKIRPSLESCGFDIGRTSSDLLNIPLKWSTDGKLPEYLTLVSGFFTNQKQEVNI